MVILRKLAFPVQSNLRAHPSKIKNAASFLETTFEPFNFHRDLCVLHRNSRSVTAPAGASADWEIIADNLSKASWSWGWRSAVDSSGRTIWIADANRGDGKRFIVRADEKLMAFAQLERAIQCSYGR